MLNSELLLRLHHQCVSDRHPPSSYQCEWKGECKMRWDDKRSDVWMQSLHINRDPRLRCRMLSRVISSNRASTGLIRADLRNALNAHSVWVSRSAESDSAGTRYLELELLSPPAAGHQKWMKPDVTWLKFSSDKCYIIGLAAWNCCLQTFVHSETF